MTRKEILNADTVAYFSGCGGIEIKSIEYGINDRVLFVAGAWTGNKTAHRARIYSDKNSELFFRYHNYKIPFSECLRANI